MNVYNIFFTNSLMNTWATINMGYKSLFAERNCFDFIFFVCALGFQRIQGHFLLFLIILHY